MSTYVLLVALWFGVACVATLLVMAVGVMFDGWQDLDFDEPEPHAQIADDVHLAKVALMAEAMKVDRELAVNKHIGGDFFEFLAEAEKSAKKP